MKMMKRIGAMSKFTTKDFVNKIAKQIEQLMEEHGTNWTKPWIGQGGGIPYNPARQQQYTGANVFGLWIQGANAGYTSNEWGTYKQWEALGKQVDKGQKSQAFSVFYSKIEREDADDYHVMRLSRVFNAEQLAGYEPESLKDKMNEVDALDAVDAFIENIPSVVKTGGSRAFYDPVEDYIMMPPAKAFIDTEDATATQSYYATMLHEHAHWTGHKSRLDRFPNNQDRKSYAYEELVAELTSVLMSAHLGVAKTPTADHAKYLNSWRQAIHDNPRVIMKAMADAEKAMKHLNSYSQTAVDKAA
jgi:antirestriction protein ArdC